MADCLKFVVLARPVLLRAQPGNALLAGADIEFEVFAVNFDLAGPMFQRLEGSRISSQLSFQVFPLQRHGPDLVLDLSDFLLSILQDEQLFELRMHRTATLLTEQRSVNHGQSQAAPNEQFSRSARQRSSTPGPAGPGRRRFRSGLPNQ